MLLIFFTLLKRDLLIAYRHKSELLNPLFFFVIVLTLFPMAISADPKELVLLGPGAIWIALTFASMLSLENLFVSDFEDGTLEQLAIHLSSFSLAVLGKLAAHWATTAMPLLIISLLLGKLFYLSGHTLLILFVSLLVGSPILIFLGALGSALTLGLKNRGLMLILLTLPLYIPVLIFGAGAANNANLNLPVASQLLFIGALFTLSLTFIPMVIAGALRIVIE